MGSRDSRDHHKHHLSVVLVKNTYCPLLSNCCGDSLDIEMKRSLPEMEKVFQYRYATDSAIDDMAEEAAEWKYLERYEFIWEEIV